MKTYQLSLKIASFFLCVYLLISLWGFSALDGWGFGSSSVINYGGRFGALMSNLLISLFGFGAFVFPFSIAFYFKKPVVARLLSLAVVLSISMEIFGWSLHLIDLSGIRGGALGHYLHVSLQYMFGYSGSLMILLGAFIWISYPMFKKLYQYRTGKEKDLFLDAWIFVLKNFKKIYHKFDDILVQISPKEPLRELSFASPVPETRHEIKEVPESFAEVPEPNVEEAPPSNLPIKDKIVYMYKNKNKNPFEKNSKYVFPILSLLEPKEYSMRTSRSELASIGEMIEKKLATYNIKGNVAGFHDGPVVSQFEFKPEDGVKIASLVNLSDDLSMALSSQSVRVMGQIPGKPTVGIEVPKKDREDVYISELLGSENFEDSNAEIPLALGKTTDGQPYIGDLAKMPHLLVAGTTGSGKSMFEAAVLCGLLYRFHPRDLKLILVDPKRVDLAIWNDIPHLLHPVVTDYKEAGMILRWAVGEMERRYDLIAKLGARNIESFNERLKKMSKGEREPLVGNMETMPKIVIMIDELADLMIVAKAEVEKSICRLAQKARAAGIHLIVATQRPSTDVITGLIKANFPTRLSFRVASYVDSKTILDKMGAEKLLGRGDMLFIPPGSSHPIRLHGARVLEGEVESVVSHVKKQLEPVYEIDLGSAGEELEGQMSFDSSDLDPLFDQAKDLIIGKKQASTSFLQRALEIGYPRAARLMDQLEAKGVVGPSKGGKSREVLA